MRPGLARRLAAITAVLLPAFADAARAQTPARLTDRRQNEVQLFAEPVSAGAQYLRSFGTLWQAGLAVGAGPLFGVTFRSADVPDVRSWAGAYAVLGFRARNGAGFFVSPVGAAVVVGNDFGAVYPSGQVGGDFAAGRLRVASIVRVIRIAGAYGSGTWWTQWVPLRLAYVLSWR